MNLQAIATALVQAGGRPYLTGGYVRDQFTGQPNKDVDIECFGLMPDQIIQAMSPFGKAHLEGVSFAVVKVHLQDTNEWLDINMPRRESKSGTGRKGFSIEIDPNLTIPEAAFRRDFPPNAIYQDMMTNEYTDPYRGIEALLDQRIDVIADQDGYSKFCESPERPLRAFQFIKRFKLYPTPRLLEYCRIAGAEYDTIAPEIIWQEWYKWATRGLHAYDSLMFLKDSGLVNFYPELKNLIGLEQYFPYHPEGSVFSHSAWTCESMARLVIDLPEQDKLVLMLAALCHDMGKATTTVTQPDGKITSYDHDQVGVEFAVSFLARIKAPGYVVDKVSELVREHMAHVHMQHISKKATRRFLSRLKYVTVDDVTKLIEADHSGRPPLEPGLPEKAQQLYKVALEVQDEVKPILLGRHLIDLGMTPGPDFGPLLREAYEAQLEEEFMDITGAMSWLNRRLSVG